MAEEEIITTSLYDAIPYWALAKSRDSNAYKPSPKCSVTSSNASHVMASEVVNDGSHDGTRRRPNVPNLSAKLYCDHFTLLYWSHCDKGYDPSPHGS